MSSNIPTSPSPQTTHVADNNNTRRPKNRLTWHRLVSITAVLLAVAKIVLGVKNLTLGSNILDGILSIAFALWVMVCGWLEPDPPSWLSGYLDTNWTPYFKFAASVLREGNKISKVVVDHILQRDYPGTLLMTGVIALMSIHQLRFPNCDGGSTSCYIISKSSGWIGVIVSIALSFASLLDILGGQRVDRNRNAALFQLLYVLAEVALIGWLSVELKSPS